MVFPNGFHGPGFYLPEWAFIRYCTKADHEESARQPESWWRKHMIKPSIIGFVAWIVIAQAVGYALKYNFGAGAPLAAVMCLVVFFSYRALFRTFHAEPLNMTEAYPEAVRLSLFSYWWQHLAAAMIAWKSTTYLSAVWQCLLFGLAGFVVYALALKGTLYLVLGIGIAPVLIVNLIIFLLVLASAYWTFVRMRRRPTAADLQPVEAPLVRAA